MISQKGAKILASTVINLAFKDLGCKNNIHRKSASSFFEDPFFLALYCDLAEVDSLAVYNRFRIIMGKKPVAEKSQEWLSNGKVGIYKHGRLVAVTQTVESACNLCGITPPTLYKHAKTGRTTKTGYQVRKNVTERKKSGRAPYLKIEICDKKGRKYVAVGYHDAADRLGVEPIKIQNILRAGRYGDFKIRRLRGYRKHGDKK